MPKNRITHQSRVVPQDRILTMRGRFAYALGGSAYGLKESGLLYFLLLFYTTVMGLPPHWVGGALAFALVVDAISDPIVGYLSDKWQSNRFHWGRRHPFMYVAAVPMALAYVFLWNPPEAMSQAMLMGWLVSFVIIIRLLSTIYDVPNAALGPELTSNYDERTTLMTYRISTAWIGGLIIAFCNWHWFLVDDMSSRWGYTMMSLTAGVLILIVTLSSAMLTHKYIPQMLHPSSNKKSFIQQIKDVGLLFKNRSLLSLFASATMISTAFGVKATMALFLYFYFWEIPSTSIKFIIYADLIATAIAFFFPVRMSMWLGKKTAFIVIAIATLLIVPLTIILRLNGLFPENSEALAFRLVLAFELISLVLVISTRALLSAMTTDLIEDTQKETSERFESFIFSINTFLLKASTGLGTFVGALILTLSGFSKDIKIGDSSSEVGAIFSNVAFYYALAFIIFYFLGIVALSFYSINKRKHEKTLNILDFKR